MFILMYKIYYTIQDIYSISNLLHEVIAINPCDIV